MKSKKKTAGKKKVEKVVKAAVKVKKVEAKAKALPAVERKRGGVINKEKVKGAAAKEAAPKAEVVINNEKVKGAPAKEAAPKAEVVINKEKVKGAPVKEAAPKAEIPKPIKETPTAAQTQTGSKTYLTIDFPVEDEKVQGLGYTIRIGSSNEGRVQISFNGAQWNPCRFNSGYWWFDWGYFMRGDYKIVARMVNDKGETIITSKERRCKVW